MGNKDRQAAWYEAHKDEFQQRNVKLPKELNKRIDEVLHAQGKTFQGWVREQAERLLNVLK